MEDLREAFERFFAADAWDYEDNYKELGKQLARCRHEYLKGLFEDAYEVAAEILGVDEVNLFSRKVAPVEARSMVYLWLVNLGFNCSEISRAAGFSHDTILREVANVRNGLDIGYKELSAHWNEFLRRIEDATSRHADKEDYDG